MSKNRSQKMYKNTKLSVLPVSSHHLFYYLFYSENMFQVESNTLKYRTWCGLCAVCERMYGRFPPRDKDPPDGVNFLSICWLDNLPNFLCNTFN